MPRKKTTKPEEELTTNATPAPEAQTGEAPTDNQSAAPAENEPDVAEQRGMRQYRALFTCPAKGFEMGENFRFQQMMFFFADNPGPEVTRKLKDAGFTYRGGEKAWTIPASAFNRELSVRLARELKGEELGPAR